MGEGRQGDEGEAREQDREGQARQGPGPEGLEGQDQRWPDQGRSLQEQARQDRLEEGLRAAKKKIGSIKGWFTAVQQARKALNVSGFVAINGKTSQGKALYAKAKAMYSA